MMKKAIVGLVLAILASVSTVSAQDIPLKIGHINIQALLVLMPEAKKADEDLKAFQKQLEDRLLVLQQEYQAKVAEYRDKEAFYTDAIKNDKLAEIASLEQRIQKFQLEAQQSLVDEQTKIQEPLLKKMQDAIQTVAKNNGFTYILDISAGNVLYFEDGEDILPLVKQQMGIQ